MPPPIRYPLPTILALIVASLLTWQGAVWSRGWRSAMAARLKLQLEGPAVPNSPRPEVIAGPITRRGLLLRDQTLATTRPNGPAAETIDRRMFVDIYDTWPPTGSISHIRVGNRGPIGWIKAGDVLEWNTRLVVRPPSGKFELADTPDGPTRTVESEGDAGACPVLAWTEKAVEVATWEQGHAWSSVARRGWVRLTDLPPDSWGVWISQVELPTLIRATGQGNSPLLVRLRAVLGRLADSRRWNLAELDAARPALPGLVFDREPDPRGAAGRLAEVNSRATTDASWSGLSFRFLPLSDLP